MIRPIAIYLPQYHPIKENDEWWGKGFTEWTNVTKAKPLYPGHHQPHLPTDLGFYDLRLQEAREAQAKLASFYGIHGFCYYHYWFNGQRLLERPLKEILASGKPDFPFMICWANENWTRRWDGLEQEILMEQKYSADDDIQHMHYLMQYFKDPRYIRVNDKPVFVLYKSFLLPDPSATAKRWRGVAAEYGLELYLCHMVFGYKPEANFLVEGFDAVIDFEPFGIRRVAGLTHPAALNQPTAQSIQNRIRRKFFNSALTNESIAKRLNIYEYQSMYSSLKPIGETGLKLFPSLVPGWDNSARKPDKPTLLLDNSTPNYFEEWLRKITIDFKPYSAEENFVFINAWNEWAEGNHLEPCRKWGTQYLEALQNVLATK